MKLKNKATSDVSAKHEIIHAARVTNFSVITLKDVDDLFLDSLLLLPLCPPSLPLSQYSSVSWSAAVKTRLTSCWQRTESGAQAKKTVETDLSMPLVISFNIIKSFYSFRSSRGPPARDDERCREGFTRPSVSLCQQSCLPSLLSLPLPNKVT